VSPHNMGGEGGVRNRPKKCHFLFEMPLTLFIKTYSLQRRPNKTKCRLKSLIYYSRFFSSKLKSHIRVQFELYGSFTVRARVSMILHVHTDETHQPGSNSFSHRLDSSMNRGLARRADDFETKQRLIKCYHIN